MQGKTTIDAEEAVASPLFLTVVPGQGRDLTVETFASCSPPRFIMDEVVSQRHCYSIKNTLLLCRIGQENILRAYINHVSKYMFSHYHISHLCNCLAISRL